MKTIKTKVLVVVFMLGTLVNYAGKRNFNNSLDAKKVRVEFKETKKGQLLKVKDENGIILYTEEVQKEGKLSKVFDFSKLTDGNYTVELEKDFQIVVKSLKIDGDTVIFDENSKKVIFKPVVRSINNTLMVSKIAFDEKPLEVSLYFRDEIIYSETLTGEAIVNRIYKLDKEIKGDYKVVIYNNGRSYINNFKI